MVQRTEVVREAQRVARVTIEQAEAHGRQLRNQAEDYVDAKLAGFESTLERTLGVVQKGRRRLQARARAQRDAGMSQEAKATLDIAMLRFTQKAPFELELGQMLMKEAETGNGDKHAEVKAEELFNSAIAHDGKLADAHYELGELALDRGDLAAALVHLKMAAKLTPSSANTHFALSRVYRRLGQGQQAAKETALFEKLKQ